MSPDSNRIALVAERWHAGLVARAVSPCRARLAEQGFTGIDVVDALMRVQLDTDVPVFSAVLTPHHFHEHGEHLAYFGRHFEVKGTELAHCGHAEPGGSGRLI